MSMLWPTYMPTWLSPANSRMSPGWSAESDTEGRPACASLVRGIATPAAAHACIISPEQSNPAPHGPVPPNTYGQPSCAKTNATAFPAWVLVGTVLDPPTTAPPPIRLCCCCAVRESSRFVCLVMSLFRLAFCDASCFLREATAVSVRWLVCLA